MKIKDLIKKPLVRVVVISIFTIAIGIVSNIFANHLDMWKWRIIIFALIVVYIAVLIFYSKSDENNSLQYSTLETQYNKLVENYNVLVGQNEAYHHQKQDYEIAMQNISDLCRDCSTQTNIQIHAIYTCPDPKQVKLTWNFDAASSMICRAAYDGIIKNSRVRLNTGAETAPSVEITYVKLVEGESQPTDSNERKISLCGYYHPVKNGTKSISKHKIIKEIAGKKHYAKLFADDITEPEVLLKPEQIQSAFGDNPLQYKQYVAIPVRCTAIDHTSKLVGIFQVASLNGDEIAPEKEDMDYLVKHFFTPFSYFFLLLYKMEKAMLAAPRKGDSNENKEQS